MYICYVSTLYRWIYATLCGRRRRQDSFRKGVRKGVRQGVRKGVRQGFRKDVRQGFRKCVYSNFYDIYIYIYGSNLSN